MVVALWDGKPTDKVGGTAAVVDFRLRGVPAEYLSVQTDAARRTRTRTRLPYSDPATRARPAGLSALRLTRHHARGSPFRAGSRPVSHQVRSYRRVQRRRRTLRRTRRPIPGSAVENLAGVASQLATALPARTTRPTLTIFVTAFLRGTPARDLRSHRASRARAVDSLRRPRLGRRSSCTDAPFAGAIKTASWTIARSTSGLRLQRVWDLAGVDASVADHYIRRQRSELDWIRVAIRTARNLDRRELVVDPAEGIVAVREFILDQLRYFAQAGRRNALQFEHLRPFCGSPVVDCRRGCDGFRDKHPASVGASRSQPSHSPPRPASRMRFTTPRSS